MINHPEHHKKKVSGHLIGIDVNVKGEPLQGFCPYCLGANIYQITDLNNTHAQRLFKGHKYLCFDCRNTFDELKPDYIGG